MGRLLKISIMERIRILLSNIWRFHHEGPNQCSVPKDVFLEESYSVDQIFS
ncbi:hypothetical protein BofuT4_uP115110.1 [Botrytis cinerea T4]|uniref:Uncharacterized protein n=1 Tax=Botryotinia fuckeliana (strain T4) TaxID=999810 RepID=G2Y2B5_BOTF4|nr:hypothetical protein BofuT4_uP115110.1 [Botrytis cinerea T4]